MRPLYVGATLQDCGKTSVSLGLVQAFINRHLDPGYIKPVGQRYINYFGQHVDEDAYLFYKVFELGERPKIMSPIAIRREFTREFIENPDVRPLEKKIYKCTERIMSHHKSMIVEGTGHAGVGSCFGLSNARVAEMLDAKVVIVAAGGIGKPIDEINLNMALFKQRNVEVIGVILNKVLPSKYEQVTAVMSKGLRLIGTNLLGAIPHLPTLTRFTIGQVAEEFGYEVLYGRKYLRNVVENTVVLAMQPEHGKSYIRKNSLVIAPIDRPESIRTAVETLKNFSPSNGALILAGGIKPDRQTHEFLRDSDIPVLASTQDTFSVSSNMVHLEFKITVADTEKIEKLKALVDQYVDIDTIVQRLQL
jgi:BioD-like phosphotransacetylase family protein